jgi:HSP20 family protein
MRSLLPTRRRHDWLARPGWDVFDRFFDDLRLPQTWAEEKSWMPVFDMSETEKEVVVKAEVPGMNSDDINLTLSDGCLTISGEKKHEEKEEKENYHRTERRYGAFCRNIVLPADVDPDKVDATYKDGVLKITMSKTASSKTKKIEIKH